MNIGKLRRSERKSSKGYAKLKNQLIFLILQSQNIPLKITSICQAESISIKMIRWFLNNKTKWSISKRSKLRWLTKTSPQISSKRKRFLEHPQIETAFLRITQQFHISWSKDWCSLKDKKCQMTLTYNKFATPNFTMSAIW